MNTHAGKKIAAAILTTILWGTSSPGWGMAKQSNPAPPKSAAPASAPTPAPAPAKPQIQSPQSPQTKFVKDKTLEECKFKDQSAKNKLLKALSLEENRNPLSDYKPADCVTGLEAKIWWVLKRRGFPNATYGFTMENLGFMEYSASKPGVFDWRITPIGKENCRYTAKKMSI